MQFVGFLLLIASVALAVLIYKIVGVAGLVAATIIFIGGMFLFIFSGIKYRQETKKNKA